MLQRLLSYDPPPDLLRDRIILVTGAADGIGRAVTMSFARHGAAVIMLDKKSRKLETLYDEIVAKGWTEPTLLVQDLKDLDPQAADGIGAGIEHDFQRLDGLLHNAGHLEELTPMQSLDPGTWNSTMQVNLTAPFVLTRSLLPLLKLSPAASILFTTSDVGRSGRAYWGPYAIAYGGVETMAQVWADELESNTTIRINTIDPGAVRTRLRNLAYPGEVAGSLKSPQEVVNAYLYLMGDDSKDVRGQALSV